MTKKSLITLLISIIGIGASTSRVLGKP